MDKIYLKLAVCAIHELELRRFEKERTRIEALPPPEKQDLSEWMKAEEKKLDEEMASVAKSVEVAGFKAVEERFSVELHDEHSGVAFTKNIQNELLPFLKRAYLPYRKMAKEEIRFQREMQIFNGRFAPVNGSIASLKARAPKKFAPELINVHEDYPISRCRELQGRFYDAWLSESLKEKAIFFDSPQYNQKLTQFYNEIYLPLHEKEQKAKEPIKVEELKPEPPPIQEKEDNGGDDTSFARRHPRLGGQA